MIIDFANNTDATQLTPQNWFYINNIILFTSQEKQSLRSRGHKSRDHTHVMVTKGGRNSTLAVSGNRQ